MRSSAGTAIIARKSAARARDRAWLPSAWLASLAAVLRPAPRATTEEASGRRLPTPADRAREREAAGYHLARARRALDRAAWAEAEQHARLALARDDRRAAAHLALGEALLRRPAADLAGARVALEQAVALEPANGYALDRLLAAYAALGEHDAAARALRRALAHGAPRAAWGAELAHLEAAAHGSSGGPALAIASAA